jgi:hypothetical protein
MVWAERCAWAARTDRAMRDLDSRCEAMDNLLVGDTSKAGTMPAPPKRFPFQWNTRSGCPTNGFLALQNEETRPWPGFLIMH